MEACLMIGLMELRDDLARAAAYSYVWFEAKSVVNDDAQQLALRNQWEFHTTIPDDNLSLASWRVTHDFRLMVYLTPFPAPFFYLL